MSLIETPYESVLSKLLKEGYEIKHSSMVKINKLEKATGIISLDKPSDLYRNLNEVITAKPRRVILIDLYRGNVSVLTLNDR